jgi:hypothetical protein
MGRRKAQTRRANKLPLINGMTEEEVLEALESLARQLGIDVRHEKGDFKGGFCSYKNQHLIILQKNEDVYKKIQTLVRELHRFDLEQIYVLPAIRELLETESELLEHNAP